MKLLLPLPFLLLAACGTDPRYAMEPELPAATAKVTRVRVATLEVKEVSMPAYVEDSAIMLEDGKGALNPVKGATWADEPTRAATLLLSDEIDRISTATAAAEPWPLETPAQAAVEVRVTEMVARATGTFDLKGQYAISSYDRIVRERIQRFAISVPLTDTKAPAIAEASGRALRQLAAQITADLAR
ncbi:PqiC family protein [Pseudooceanicola sp. C21-150M6]|uniref:PqiC family protein n=1 Tax=Pseudooceanicola sp. C21-150M6 TaxID=3434355 RepID=UPI003D7F6B01